MMGGRSVSLMAPLHRVFDDVLHFVRVQDELYTRVSAEVMALRRQQAARARRAEEEVRRCAQCQHVVLV